MKLSGKDIKITTINILRIKEKHDYNKKRNGNYF